MYSERLRDLEYRIMQEGSEHIMYSGEEPVESYQESIDVKPVVADSDLSPALAGMGIGVASMFLEVLLSHPFIVMRNQCQVLGSSHCLHLTPFSLIPVVRRCIQSQGLSFLWKGLGSVFIIRGLNFMTENLVCQLTSLPKEVSKSSSFRRLLGHLFLKMCSWVIITPFFAASCVEIIQSDKASEPTTLVSCVRDGFYRLFHMPSSPRLGSPGSVFRSGHTIRSIPIATSRLLPVWRLFLPVVLLNVGHYVVRSFSSIVALSYWNDCEDRLERDAEIDLNYKAGGLSRSKYSLGLSTNYSAPNIHTSINERRATDLATLAYRRQDTALQTIYNRYYTDLFAGMTANCAADVVLYPIETMVLRLCVQGTRTLVDNMDTGDVVVPIVSSYDGFFDALRSSLDLPVGFLGLYKGFGALIAQYALQALFVFGIRCLYEHLLCLWPPPPTDKIHSESSSRQNASIGFEDLQSVANGDSQSTVDNCC
ncbi:Solute carrier family 25 member 46 [Schistosoma japonicum]|nr:Solute carrier family 25 member 46 [Schistosoma japonicum]KAH8865915.1 Solute carrier family 25 member 46 [Schistosoma japonicum]KAH8865916.1 Solute carrier family 25 member 46 [Schistosoma japonicum]